MHVDPDIYMRLSTRKTYIPSKESRFGRGEDQKIQSRRDYILGIPNEKNKEENDE